MYVPFEEISDNSKCWVYILDNSIENFSNNINSLLIEICDNWKSHNLNIRSSYKIYKNFGAFTELGFTYDKDDFLGLFRIGIQASVN